MKYPTDWYDLYSGSGSVSGNEWIEEVCYLGKEQWLLSIRDDPAFAVGETVVQEPEARSSSDLASWAVDMDSTDEEESYPRVHSLLAIAIEVGAKECATRLRHFLRSRENNL